MELEPTEHATDDGDASAGEREDPRLFARVKAKLFGQGDPEPTRIGRYALLKRIGEGGMGLIYAAYDDSLDRKVAVKLLRPERLTAGSQGRARLLREAQALAKLSHPSVIHVYEVGTWEDQVYIAMEYIQGSTLKQWQNNRNWPEVLEAYRLAGAGLQAAHEAGIVHRDFKSDNVLIRHDASPNLGQGAVRVLDFGLARTEIDTSDAEIEAVRSQPVDSDAPLTHTGAVMGTPAYMAPEQHAGRQTEPRSDQFSFCVALFEGLYGYRPFQASTLIELQTKVLEGAVEPAPKFTEVPPRVHQAILRGLSVDPRDRYPSMQALLDDLAEGSIARRWKWALLGGGALVVATAMLMWPAEGPDPAAVAQGKALQAAFDQAGRVDAETELARLRGRSLEQRWDDLILSFARSHADHAPTRALAALKHLDPSAEGWLPAARPLAAQALLHGPLHRRVDGVSNIARMRFSSDGSMVATVDADGEPGLWRIPGQYRTLDPDDAIPPVRDAAIGSASPPFTVWLATETGALWRWRDGQSETFAKVSDAPLQAVAVGRDGSVAVGDAEGVVHWFGDGSSEPTRRLADHQGAITSLDIAPNGSTLVSGSTDSKAIVWFLDRRTHRTLEIGASVDRVRFVDHGEAIAVWTEGNIVERWTLAGLRLEGGTHTPRAWDAASDGRALWFDGTSLWLGPHGDTDNLVQLDTEGTQVETVALDPSGRTAVAASSDDLLAWRIGGDAQGRTSTGHVVLLGEARVHELDFLHDGTLLVLDSLGTVRRWSPRASAPRAAGHDAQPWLPNQGRIETIAVAPDGHSVAAAVADRRLLLVDDSEELHTVGTVHGEEPPSLTWSPDGRFIAARSCDHTGACAVDVIAADGSGQWSVEVWGEPAELRFSRDGTKIVVVHNGGIWVRSLQGGQHRAAPAAWSPHKSRVVAWDFADDAIRIALTSDARPGPADLEIWWLGPNSTATQRILAKPQLPHLVANSDGRTLLLRTQDKRTLLWHLDEEAPTALLSAPEDVRWLEVSPDRRTLLVYAPAQERPALLDIDSGQLRYLDPYTGPHEWGPDRAVAIGTQDVRLYFDPAPTDPIDFLRWLGQTTEVTIELEDLR